MSGIALALLTALAAPPTDPPLPVAPGEAPERRLAEFSFAMFVTLEFGVDPGAFTCAGPDADSDADTITCFALTAEGRVIIATTTSSNGTGVFDWELVSDQTIAGDPSVTTTTELPPPPTSEGGAAPTNDGDAAILSYGEELNQSADATAADFVEYSEGAIRIVNLFAWEAATATVTLDVTLNPTMVIDHDRAAWILVQAVKVHWVRTEPFRLDGATLRPAFVLVIGTTRYESDFDLMVQVADQLISREDWATAARQA
jgi:hypothetical protein